MIDSMENKGYNEHIMVLIRNYVKAIERERIS